MVAEHKISPPYLRLTLFTVALSLLIFTAYQYKPELIYPGIKFVMAFYYAIFLLSYYLIHLSYRNTDGKQAVILNLAAVVIRLVACIIAAFFFMKFDPENTKLFSTNFLVIYLFYLGFEIYSILSNLRPHLKQ